MRRVYICVGRISNDDDIAVCVVAAAVAVVHIAKHSSRDSVVAVNQI